MKIYFGAAITHYRELLPMYQSIVSLLEENGHEVLSKHVVEAATTRGDWEKEYDPEKLFDREVNKVKQADLVITELTTPSWGTAFLIAEAIKANKPLLSLYYSHYEGKVPLMLRGNKQLNLQMYTEENLKQIVNAFLAEQV